MIDLHQFFRVTNPTKTLEVENPDDRKYYIDFSSVRGENIIETLRDNISLFYPDQPTYDLFTGHIGCGKSTELLRLKAELQEQNFYVIYFESDQDLEMSDIDISDILLAIAYRVIVGLEASGIYLKSRYFQSLIKELKEMLPTLQLPEGSCLFGVSQLIAKTKASPQLRGRLRGYLEPHTNRIIDAINGELFEPAIEKLQQQGKHGLVVIIDNLDRVDFSPKPWGRLQPEYLFVDRSNQLRSLHCHVIYTIPLALLRFSDDYKVISERFMVDPLVLPMVPVCTRDGQEHEAGMARLRQMVLARGFPDLDEAQRLNRITEIFDRPETLDRLCRASGGHVRNLLRFLNKWIRKERRLPLSNAQLEEIIRDEQNQAILGVVEEDWELMRQVAQQKKTPIANNAQKLNYQKLLRNLLILEYRDKAGPWFDINPILANAEELQL